MLNNSLLMTYMIYGLYDSLQKNAEFVLFVDQIKALQRLYPRGGIYPLTRTLTTYCKTIYRYLMLGEKSIVEFLFKYKKIIHQVSILTKYCGLK